MNKLKQLAITSLFTGFIYGCSTDIEQYNQVENSKAEKPFDIKTYFTGPVIAWGMIQNYSEQVSRRFCVEVQGSWQGNKGVLAETFYFDDGEVSYRNWQLIKKDNGIYQGTAEDVVGTAQGQHAGFAFHWQYTLKVPVDDDIYNLTLDDWMYQLDNYRVVNKTKMKKLGITVADVTLFFDKSVPEQGCLN